MIEVHTHTRVLGFAVVCGRSGNCALPVPRVAVLAETLEISVTEIYSKMYVTQGVAGG